MKICKFSVKTTHDGQELVADVLMEVTGGGIAVYDSNDLAELYKSDIVWDYVDASLLKANPTVLVCCFTGEEHSKEVRIALENSLGALALRSEVPLGSLELTEDRLDDEDWYETWKKFYAPIEAGGMMIVPVWQNAPQSQKTVIRIDPGMAFGTGEHESTRLCLTLLDKLDVKARRVIDVGTGSGILGISALLSGASYAYMCDIDGLAVDNAKKNAELNGVAERCTIEKSVLAGAAGEGDVIFANITADILIGIVQGIKAHLAAGGSVILSGIIKERAESVKSAYIAAGFKVKNELTMGSWCGLLLGIG